jgi:hypothetical protein
MRRIVAEFSLKISELIRVIRVPQCPKGAVEGCAMKTGSKEKVRYPMPCPGCHRIIDARERYCPYCGVDTDAKLWPLRAALPLVAVASLLVIGVLLRAGLFFYAVLIGLALGLAVAWWLRRRA